jgi:hypothetical protein
MRDSSGQVGQVLLQLVAQCNFHEWRHQRLQSPACRGGGLLRKISMIRQPAP